MKIVQDVVVLFVTGVVVLVREVVLVVFTLREGTWGARFFCDTVVGDPAEVLLVWGTALVTLVLVGVLFIVMEQSNPRSDDDDNMSVVLATPFLSELELDSPNGVLFVSLRFRSEIFVGVALSSICSTPSQSLVIWSKWKNTIL